MNDSTSDPQKELDALFALARTRRPDTARLEYAFETRLMGCLRSARNPDSIWALVCWRSIPFFAAGMMALMIWQAEAVSESNDALALASTENPEVVDVSNMLDGI